jgi:hypothetical protein
MKKTLWAALALILTACGTSPLSSTPQAVSPPRPLQEPAVNAPANTSVLIKGRSSKAILDAIQQNRTARGMKMMSRGPYRIQFSQAMPGANPPTEVRMIYQLSQEGPHLRLSAQVLRISYPGRANESITDISRELASKIESELESYAR